MNDQSEGPNRDSRGETVGEMNSRRETMADGKRYIVYYTFGEVSEPEVEKKENESV